MKTTICLFALFVMFFTAPASATPITVEFTDVGLTTTGPPEGDAEVHFFIPVSGPITSIEFDLNVFYDTFEAGAAFGSQFLLEITGFTQIQIGTIGDLGWCPAIVACEFNLMWADEPGSFSASGIITSFSDGTPLSDGVPEAAGDWTLAFGTLGTNPNDGPEGFASGFVTINVDDGSDPVPIPEPGSLALLGIGLLGIAAVRRSKKS